MEVKILRIETRIADNKIATAIQTEGLSQSSIEDVLMLKGIVDNLKNLFDDKIKTLMEKKL